MSGTFEGFGSEDDPDEYAGYEWVIEVHREMVVTGGGENLEDQGFEYGEGSMPMGRPITNDNFGDDEEEEPEGQIKRVVVIAIRRVGEDAADDRTLRIMTFLPNPGEEEQDLSGGGAAGPGGAGGTAGAAGGTSVDATSSIRSSSGSRDRAK
jgi:hypothetical protein